MALHSLAGERAFRLAAEALGSAVQRSHAGVYGLPDAGLGRFDLASSGRCFTTYATPPAPSRRCAGCSTAS